MRRTKRRPLTLSDHRLRGALLLAVLLVATAWLGTGCGEEATTRTQFTPNLAAASAADSLAPGAALNVIVHWRRTNACQNLEALEFAQISDTLFQLVVVGVDERTANTTCPDESSIQEASFPLTMAPSGHFTVEVFGASQRFVLGVEGGAVPAKPDSMTYKIHVRNAAKPTENMVGATTSIFDVGSPTPIAIMTIGVDGIADTTLVCPPSGVRSYNLEVVAPVGRTVVLPFVQNPARCGIPQRTEMSL